MEGKSVLMRLSTKMGILDQEKYKVDDKHGERLGRYYENFHENGHLASRGWIDGYEGTYWGTWDYFSHWGHLICIEQHGGEPKDFDRKAFFGFVRWFYSSHQRELIG